MKICMIGHKQVPSRKGGVEIVVEKLAEQLVQMGIEVDLYNRKDRYQKSPKEYKGIHIYEAFTIQVKSLDAIIASFFATVKAVRKPYDLMHYHAEGPCLMLWLPHLLGKRIIVTIHGLDWQRAKWGKFASRVLLLGEKMAVKYADEIIVLSRNMQEYFEEVYGRKTIFLPNAVSTPQRREPDLIRQKYQLEEESYILFLARIVPEKGLHYLLDAYEQLNTDKKLVIAGDTNISKEYGKNIRNRCSTMQNVILTGFVEGQILEELFSNAAVYVLPSEIEGMAISLLEAMSYGRCCLVSDIPENTELVKEYAETFKCADAESLREKLSGLLCDEEERRRMGEKAKEYVLKTYEWQNIAKQTREVYES